MKPDSLCQSMNYHPRTKAASALIALLIAVSTADVLAQTARPSVLSKKNRFAAKVLTIDAPRKSLLSTEMTTRPISLKPNDFVLCWLAVATSTRPVKAPTVSGAGVAWELDASVDVNGGPRRLFVYSGAASKAVTEALTFRLGQQRPTRMIWAIIRYDNAKSVTQIAIAKDSTARDGAGEIIFKNVPDGPVAATVFGSIRTDIEAAQPPELAEHFASPFRLQTVYGALPEKELQWTWKRGVHYLGIGVELDVNEP